jgi:hypothetical protein
VIDVGGDALGLGYLLTGAAALVTALRNGRKIKATSDKVDSVAAQVATSNGKTIGAMVEGSENRHLLSAVSGDLTAAERVRATELGRPLAADPTT